MIKKKSYWILMLTAICILAVTGCKKEGKTADFHIYYTDSEGGSLVEKGIKPEGKTQKEQIDEILDKIQKNTDDIDYRSPFVKEVKVKEWSVKDGKLIVDFNRNYQKLSATEEILLRAAVVQSVGQISGVAAVLFTIDGESLQDMNGQVVGYMQPSDFVKNTGVSLHSYQKETFLLYYGNKQGDRLVKEKVSIRYNSSISKEKVLVEQLIKGPSSDNETAVIPAETKVLSVSVKDHICYVNLDKGFLDTTNVMNPELPVYAIVNTIIEGSSIGRVQILIDGKDITRVKEYKRNQKIGRVYQNPSMGTCPSMTILENMSLADNKGRFYGLGRGTNKARIDYYREQLAQLGLGLEDKLHVKVGSLSGGQRQAMALLMSTMTPIEFLILDEHTAALDPKTAELIMELTDKIVKEKNLTTVMVTHNLRYAVEYGNRLIMMHQGHCVMDKAGKEKEDTSIDEILTMFNEISIECGN